MRCPHQLLFLWREYVSNMLTFFGRFSSRAAFWAAWERTSCFSDMVRALRVCYIYGLCLPLRTYLLADKWLIVQKCLRTSLGTPLCILFCFLLTYWHFLMLLGRCTVHGTLLTEGSASESTLDSCTVQETSMADGSASEVLQTCGLYSVWYMEMYFTLYCTWRCHIGHTCI